MNDDNKPFHVGSIGPELFVPKPKRSMFHRLGWALLLAYAVGPLFAALVAAAFGEFALGGRLVAIQALMWLLAVIYAVGRKS